MTLACLVVIPQLSLQITDFIERIPEHMIRIRNAMAFLPERYPDLITHEQVAHLTGELTRQLNTTARQLVLHSISGLVSVIGAVVYIFLVPVLVFFIMKDKDRLARWLLRFLPADRTLVNRIGRDIDVQMSNYIRGKTIEMLIVGVAAYILFHLFGLNYSILLATLVGLSVFVPWWGPSS